MLAPVAAQEEEGHRKAHCLRENGRVPQRVPAEDGRERQQHGTLQHEPAADGDADSRDGALQRRQESADDHIEADEQI